MISDLWYLLVLKLDIAVKFSWILLQNVNRNLLLTYIMSKTDIYTGVDFHIYPLELFILLIGFILGVIIGSLNDKTSHK